MHSSTTANWRERWVAARALGWVGVLCLLAVALPGVGGLLLLASLGEVGPWMASYGFVGWLSYVVGFIVLAGLALLPTFALAALGGWAFGWVAGFAGAWLGIVGGSTVGYVIARCWSGRRVEQVVAQRDEWTAAYRALVKSSRWQTTWLVMLLRLPPNAPFAGTNVLLASCRVPWFSYVLGTAMGMAPRTLAAVLIASSASVLRFDNPYSLAFFAAGLVLLVLALWVIGRIARRAMASI